MILTILLGLAGLGLVVLVHELGHFAAARAVGVEVEAFSIGWGPRLFSWKRGATEWRVSVFPIGGYCRMKGEEAFRKAIADKSETIPREPGTFYGASPWKRIAIALSGPVANVLFAAVVFVAVAAVGYTVRTSGNRIVLASEFSLDGKPAPTGLPADAAGLKSGDRVVAANGKPVRDYADLQEVIALNPEERLDFAVERDGTRLDLAVTPRMDKSSGAGRIGIYAWTEPLVEGVVAGSAADIAGVKEGDRVVSVGGEPVRHAIELLSRLSARPERVVLGLDRRGESVEARLVLSYEGGGSNLGLSFATLPHTVKSESLGLAFSDGLRETWKTFSISVQGLGLLFRGVDVFKAISGPARITWLVGSTASEGMAESGANGLVVAFNFLGFLSIGLFIMNLLPIPALDGGMILMFAIEGARRKPLRTKTVYRFQFIGMAFILALFVLATVSDLIFFAGK